MSKFTFTQGHLQGAYNQCIEIASPCTLRKDFTQFFIAFAVIDKAYNATPKRIFSVWTSLSLRATSHRRLRARDHYTSITLIGGKRRSWSKFASQCAWGTKRVCECKMDVKPTWLPTWHHIDHNSWSLGLFLKPRLGGSLTQNRETMALQTFTTVDLFNSIMGEDLHESKSLK